MSWLAKQLFIKLSLQAKLHQRLDALRQERTPAQKLDTLKKEVESIGFL